jgi:hypothetical protein
MSTHLPRRPFAPASLFLLFAGSCSSIPVQQDYDPAFDFGRLGSYAWLEQQTEAPPSSVSDSSLIRDRVHRAVDARMSAMGHAKTIPEQASFLIAYHIGVDRELRVDTTNYGYGYGYRGYGRRGYTETRVRQYDVGTLVLDFVSNDEEKKLLWRGTGSSRIHERRTPEQREELIRQVVDAVLAQFPPSG